MDSSNVIEPRHPSRTERHRNRAIELLEANGPAGLTVAELRDDLDPQASALGALSYLHKRGKIARLTEERGRVQIYVLPKHVDGRSTRPHGYRPARAE